MKSLLDGTTEWRYNPAWSLDDDGTPHIWHDEALTMKAKGIWSYMKSKPANWDFSAKRIAEECKDSKNPIAAGLKELEATGYLSKRKLGSGRMHYTLSHSPFMGIEPTIEKSSLEGYEIIMDEPKSRNLCSYPKFLAEHLCLAYSAYCMTHDEAQELIEEQKLYSIQSLNEWMDTNSPLPEQSVCF